MKIVKGEVVRVKKTGFKALILEVLNDGKQAKVHVKDGPRLDFEPIYREYELERI